MMKSMVDSAGDILLNPKTPLRELGELMHQSWQLKRVRKSANVVQDTPARPT
jgi:hypothetical protein